MQQSQKIFSLYRPSVGFKLAETQPVAYSLAFERHVSSVFTYGKAGGLEGKKAAEFFSRHMYTGRFHPQHVTGAVPCQSYFSEPSTPMAAQKSFSLRVTVLL